MDHVKNKRSYLNGSTEEINPLFHSDEAIEETERFTECIIHRIITIITPGDAVMSPLR